MPLITLIVNPTSGRGAMRSRDWSRDFSEEVSVRLTAGSGDAERIAREVAPLGGTVVAVGGDGTVSEVAAGLIGSPSTLAVLPCGTGNDFARTLGLGTDLVLAFSTVVNGDPKQVDMIRWTCGDRKGYGINVAGCGFDALVAERINKGFRFLRGTAAYVAAVAVTLGSYRPSRLKLSVDGELLDTSVMLCAIANARSYGGGMLVAPTAELDDGLLDVVVVEGVSKLDFIRAFPSVFSGSHLSHPRVRHLRGRRIEVVAEPALPVLNDGELIGVTPVTFEVVPQAIRILSPRREGAPASSR